MRCPMRDLYQNIAVVTTSYPSHERDWAGHFVRQEVLELERQSARVTVMTRTSFSTGGVRAASLAWLVARACSALRRERFDRVIVHWALPVALAVPGVELVSHGGDVRLLASLPA